MASVSRSENVIEVIEKTLERPLDPDLITNISELTVEDLTAVKDAYLTLAQGSIAPENRVAEFWPVSHQLIERPLHRDRRSVERATRDVLRQLLYAHGAIALDPLGRLLADALGPRRAEHHSPVWGDDGSHHPSRLANYLETLAYLRPLIDSGLLVLRPEPIPHHRDQFLPILGEGRTFDSLFLASDYNHATGSAVMSRKGRVSQAQKTMEAAFGAVLRKLQERSEGLPGDLILETQFEGDAFTWLIGEAQRPDGENLTLIEGLRLPSLEDLEPADVVALHTSDTWGDFRAALRRGLERVASLGDVSRTDGAAIVQEEMGALERSAMHATKKSAFLAARATANRDLMIGAALASGMTPLVGPEAAASAFGASVARTGATLLYGWLKAKSDASERAVARCFTVFR